MKTGLGKEHETPDTPNPHLICKDQLRSRWWIPVQRVRCHRRCGATGVYNSGSEPVQQGVEPLMSVMRRRVLK